MTAAPPPTVSADAREPQRFAGESPACPRVLLVDDDEINLLLTALALRERGFIVQEASGGAQALELLERAGPSDLPELIVLDAMMPGLDGFDTCRRLRALPGCHRVPVLMLTGLDDDASVQRALYAGATDFLVKSTQWSLLALRLKFLLRAYSTLTELERSNSKLARAQDLARMGSFDWRRGRGLQLSPEALRMLGLGPEANASPRTLLRLVPRNERRPFMRLLAGTLRRACVLDTDVPLQVRGGGRRIIHLEAEPEFNDLGQGIGYMGIAQDVTDRREAEDQIRHLANFDDVTGLPNRHQLITRAQRALEAARRLSHSFALLLIDLDQFKRINDTLGHGAGDELLVEVGRRLRACVRHSDQLIEAAPDSPGQRGHRVLESVARLGGDEFVALLPEVGDEEDAAVVARRVLEAMRQPVLLGGQDYVVTASVGVALYPRDGTTVADLLRNADVAMYAVKDEGRNNLAVYSPSLSVRGRERLELESALYKALERDELVLHYQPRVDVAVPSVVGLEALMRWQRGDRLVQPAEFIPLAEQTGLIVPLSRWALREAARQSRQWKDEIGFEDVIAVNVPGKLFLSMDLAAHLQECMASAGLPHQALMLEITEGSLARDIERIMAPLRRVDEIGVQIAIDDFGVDHSSLSRLATLPVAELKIDRSFVSELGLKPQSEAIITAIIALGQALRLRVVAEGVETTRQMEVLHRLGCSTMQGFHFSRPMPAAEFPRWLRQARLPHLPQPPHLAQVPQHPAVPGSGVATSAPGRTGAAGQRRSG
jgi:predicted signal transduction protein with EAL and GGDEF domain/DNA-binding response OmpR family regulator